VLGQAVGTGVGGAIVAGSADGLGHRAGVALAFGFALVVSVISLLAGGRLPTRLLGHEAADPAPPTSHSRPAPDAAGSRDAGPPTFDK
jgi:hypothetical protein